MKILTRYILGKYFKSFFIILISLEGFFIGIDFLQNIKNLPSSANLQLLYLFYNGFFTLTITLPLSIVFGWIITLAFLIRNNELVSFYSFGISKKMILNPIILTSTFITLLLIGLQMTPLAYAYEKKTKILNDKFFVSEKSNIFLKYNEYFVYFKKLFPLEKKAVGIIIFKLKNNNVIETIIAKQAFYKNKKWYVEDAKIITKPEKIDWDKSKLTISHKQYLYTLDRFEPKIINSVYQSNSYFSILDAIEAIKLLKYQDFNIDKIKSILFGNLFTPFFIIPLIIIFFIYSGISSRFFNTNQFISISIFVSLILWGLLFLLLKLSIGSVILPEIGILMPLIILFFISTLLYIKKL